MTEQIVLGIDCGGTHTDAALLGINRQKGLARLIASAKTVTRHDNLPLSITEAVKGLFPSLPDRDIIKKIERVTLGTTLEVNAIVQNRTDKVGLALSAGPGLDPLHFTLGEYICIVPGGLDHRGVEVSPLYTRELASQAAIWPERGVAAIACVGKFSPRNPAHEEEMGKVAQKASGLPVTLGHKLSGRLNFPRRIATAYYNAAVGRLHQDFLDSVESALRELGIQAQLRLLKADGGAIPFSLSRQEPVQSILSGPAASVMGVLALWENASSGCSLLLDMGGTTTDIALFLAGSPVVDREGMKLNGRRTLVRSLASISIGVGGDSLLNIRDSSPVGPQVCTGPLREGPAMAFGGCSPTLLDALNTLDADPNTQDRGDVQKSVAGLEEFTLKHGFGKDGAREVAQMAVTDALNQIVKAVYDLVENINAKPIYTLAALKSVREARPQGACLVGGPAECLRERLQTALGLPVEIAPHPHVANAIGAALSVPTASLELYADTGKGELTVPALNYLEPIGKNFTLEQAKARALNLLADLLKKENMDDAKAEIVEADLFATLDDYGRGARDMRVSSQVLPGIIARVSGQA